MGKLFWTQWLRPQQKRWQELKKQGIIIPGPVNMDEYMEIKMFTVEEERMLKLMIADVKARIKLNIANVIMGNEIRAEFSVIDTRIRKEHEPTITPLEADVKTAQDNLKVEFE